MPDALAPFSPATREWFRGAFSEPTAVQTEAWRAISAGRHALVVAPTGSGKTLAAFLWALDRLIRADSPPAPLSPEPTDEGDEPDARPRGRTRVIYVSPLKALGVDVERNLHAPLVGITQTALRLGVETARPRVAVRSGDTPAAERNRQLRQPPDILITTPESLYLMLTSKARQTLTGVETVILDEVHAVAGSKRGAHLALTLERLDALLERPAQRIGLSATVSPLSEVARFVGGSDPVEIVAPPSSKAFDLRVSVPVEDMSDIGLAKAAAQAREADPDDPFAEGSFTTGSAAGSLRDPGQPQAGSIWPFIEEDIVDMVAAHRSTIVFANSRRLAERLTADLNEIWAARVAAEAEVAAQDAQEGPRGHDPDAAAGRRSGHPDSGSAASEAPILARAHHGSVSKEARAEVEDALKAGELRCVVATSSLELGIDMGDVDLVLQVEAPPSVASGLQRLGRAGHQVGEVSRGALYPKHRADVLHSGVVALRMLNGEIEQLRQIENPLDVLAQQTIAAAATDDLDVEEWFDTVRRAAPFAKLPRSVYEATLDLVSGKYPSEQFGELRPRLVWDRDEGTLRARPGAQRLAVTSGGTIPDRGMFGVFIAGGEGEGDSAASGRGASRRVGELDEEMVYESRVGDVFALGTTSWRITEITHDRVVVVPAFGEPGKLPFWRGDALGRPAELGEAIGRITREIANALPAGGNSRAQAATTASDRDAGNDDVSGSLGIEVTGDLAGLAPLMDDRARANLIAYLSEQRASTGRVPSDIELVVERFRDELGDWRLILHSPYGKSVHAPWALIVNARITERYGVDGSVIAADDGIIVRLPDADAEPPGAELFILDPDEIEPVVSREVGGSALFASRFREAAARALLLPRLHPGKRSPLWQQRQKASQLLDVAREHPTFPIILETVREVLNDVYDLPALRELAKRIERREVRVIETATDDPSPYARTLLFGYVGAFLYEGDSPLAERKAAALAIDAGLLADLLGKVELRELLDASVIGQVERELQRLAAGRRARDAEGAADLLRLLGPLSVAEIAARSEEPDIMGDDADAPGNVGTLTDASLSDDSRVAPTADAIPDPAAQDAARAGRMRDTAAEWVEELIAAKRALKVRIAGEERIAAIEDAARLRDALGVPLPIGVPTAFIEPVPDPVGDLVTRYARTHGPFAASDIAERLGVGIAVVQEALGRLAVTRRVIDGEFRPGATGQEWVDAEVLRRIRSRSLAALRSEIEPVTEETFARFLPAWQHAEGDLRGLDGLVTAIDQLAGCPVPASALETFILPARVRDYSPTMLDELAATGEVRWVGHGPIPGGDGWVSLHLDDTAALTLPTHASGDPDEIERRILEALHQQGAMFFRELQAALHVPDDTPVITALWNLVWQGRVTNDAVAPLRGLVTGGPGGSSSAAHRAPRRAARGRLARTRPSSGAARLAGGGIPASASGRWTLSPVGETDATERAAALGDVLLDRYGVVTKGSVVSEQVSGGFAVAYRALSGFEESGRARRGYFIEHLGAAQFSTAGAIDRLRTFSRDPGAEPDYHAVTLAATDPANPFGAALPWPDRSGAAGADDPSSPDESGTAGTASGTSASGHRPGRKAGGLVTIVDGQLILYVERGGKTLLSFTDDESVLATATASLADAVHRARIPNLVIEKANGAYILGAPIATWMEQAGFQRTPRGFRAKAPL